MTTPKAEIGAVTAMVLSLMRRQLEEAAAIARAAEACAQDGQPARGLTIAFDVEPLAVEANNLLQGLATINRIAGSEQNETGS